MPRYLTVKGAISPALAGGASVEAQAVGLVLEGDGAAVSQRDRRNRHALAVGGRGQIEPEASVSAVLDEPHGHGGFAGDFVGLVAERDAEDVVLDVDAGLSRIGIGGKPLGEQRRHQERFHFTQYTGESPIPPNRVRPNPGDKIARVTQNCSVPPAAVPPALFAPQDRLGAVDASASFGCSPPISIWRLPLRSPRGG